MSLPRVRLVTFADGHRTWTRAAARLVRQARRSGWILDCKVYDLKTAFDGQLERDEVLNMTSPQNTKGHGYWSWKPALIQQNLSANSDEFDVLLYLDAGCSLNIRTQAARERFFQYCDLAMQSGALTFRLRDQLERRWTKMDTFSAICSGNREFLDENQMVGGILFFCNSSKGRELADEWLHYALDQSMRLIDDSPSMQENHEEFRAHRHDQSIWSLVAKKHKILFLEDETYFYPHWKENGRNFPIWATRNRTGLSVVSERFYWKAFRKILALF